MGKNPRILMAIDGSDRSLAASAYIGKVLSKQAEVVLFHVMAEIPETFRDLNAESLAEKENFPLNVWKTQQEETIHEFTTTACDILTASGFPKKAISIKTQILKSGVARDILEESHQNYDALVLGRTGISKIEDISLGSVASKLVDVVAYAPIIVVGEDIKSKKVIIAIDGSEGSMKAVQCAGKLLDPFECEILLCNVIRPLYVPQMAAKKIFSSKHEADWIVSNKKKIIPVINAAKSGLKKLGFTAEHISVEFLTYQRSRAAAIAKAATKGGYGTIVLGRRGFTSLKDFRIGRVSRKILHFAYRAALWVVS